MISLRSMIAAVIMTRKYSMSTCWNSKSSAPRAKCSANISENTPQSHPFSCLGMRLGYLAHHHLRFREEAWPAHHL